MQFKEAFKLALQSLWANKLRSILTLIGVVMGVASVIMVITLTNTANDYFGTKLSGYGADVFTISRAASVTFSPEEYFRFQKRKILKYEDYEAVREGCASCKEVGTLLSKNTNVVHNNQSSTDTSIRGYTDTMFSLNNINIAVGRALTEPDIDHGTHAAVVGYDIVDNLLGDGDPIGKEIRVDGNPYTIVGVGERQGKTFGQSQDNWVAVPITTYQHTYGSNDTITIYCRANGDASSMEKAEDEARVIMRSRRHDAPGAPDSFELETNDTFLQIWKQISSLFTFIVFGLASISLVVGGVVIMNIMLVSVTERTREIGVRKALGARQKDVLLQFLIESALMATLGGAIGIAIGVGVAVPITMIFNISVSVSIGSIILGLL
ncbi:MAG TPA: ABC transporter permease, partial [Acidobacteriaceae bacterium]